MSIGLCIAILCQLNKTMDTPKVFFSPEAKAGNYSNLNDAAVDAWFCFSFAIPNYWDNNISIFHCFEKHYYTQNALNMF